MVDIFEVLFPKHVVAKVTLVSNIKIDSREPFTYLHSETFYFVYTDLFDGPNGIDFTHYYIPNYTSCSNAIKVETNNELEVEVKGNVMISSIPLHNNQVQVHIKKEKYSYEIFSKGTSPYKLDLSNLRKEYEIDY